MIHIVFQYASFHICSSFVMNVELTATMLSHINNAFIPTLFRAVEWAKRGNAVCDKVSHLHLHPRPDKLIVREGGGVWSGGASKAYRSVCL